MLKFFKISFFIFIVLFVIFAFIYCYVIINFTIYGKVPVQQFLYNILINIKGIGEYIELIKA